MTPTNQPTDNTGLIEPVAWLYSGGGMDRQYVSLTRPQFSNTGDRWTETPLIPAAALATKDAEIARLKEMLGRAMFGDARVLRNEMIMAALTEGEGK